MRSGFIPLGRWRGVAVRLHWSAFASAGAFSLFRPWPMFWGAFLFLLFAHALGHAIFAKRCGLGVRSLYVHGLGGEGRWWTETTRRKHALIAWGGLAAQLCLLAATGVALALRGPPATPYGEQWVAAWTWANGALMALHLLPFRPFDGRDAWRLLPLLVRRHPRPTSWREALWEAFRTPCEDVLPEPAEEERLPPQIKAQIDQIAADVRARSVRRSTNRQ